MATFRVIPGGDLAERHFDEWPVWSEYYDYEEIEDVERWGLDREKVLRQFQANERDGEHCVYTLLETDPFPERMRIFIRAELKTSGGIGLKGNVMDEEAFVLTVYVAGESFMFSRHPLLEDLNREQERQLERALNVPPGAVFPIQYRTAYTSRNGEPIAGNFQYGTRET